MVYESDFYTTRRPYTRPVSSAYSVTSPTFVPLTSIIQVRNYPHLPYVAHKRLVTFVHSPIHSVYHTGTPIPIRIHSRVRPSVLAAEYNRIRELPRTSSKSYTERYLNSQDNILFDDETRQIRAKADSLLRRIHVFVPRPSASDFHDEIVPERLRSDDYIRRLLGARKNVAKEIELSSWYQVPEQRNLGKGNLACVQYVGGKPHSRRRPYYKLADLRPADVKNDVNLLSFYSKNRQAAANASPASPLTERELRKARAVEPEWIPSAASTATAPKKIASPPPQEQQQQQQQEEEVEIEAQVPVVVATSIPDPIIEEVTVEKKKEKKEKKVKKPTEEELRRQAEEARLEEERRIAAEIAAEEARIAYEKAQEEARLAEIAEQERLEAERIAEEERLEAERLEAERLEEEERLAIEAAAVAEEERIAAQKLLEDELKKQEEEERLAAEAAANATELLDAGGAPEEDLEDVLERQQELEERQIETIVDEEPQIDEVEVAEDDEDANTGAETFVEEPVNVEGGNSQPEEPIAEATNEEPKIEEVTSSSGGADDVWGDNEDA